jgi:hypothetical protein
LLALYVSHRAAIEELSLYDLLSFHFHMYIILQENSTSAIIFRVVKLCVLIRLRETCSFTCISVASYAVENMAIAHLHENFN